jgi:hypothetical protein
MVDSMDNNWDLDFLDMITILSFVLGVENLRLNEQQSGAVMEELRQNQNSMLSTIIKQNEEIIRLLKGQGK